MPLLMNSCVAGAAILDVARDHSDHRALLDQLERARLLVLQLVVADVDLEPAPPDAALGVDLRRPASWTA